MRGGIIIALIVVGHLERTDHQANTVRLLERPGSASVNLYREDLPIGPQVGSWVVGTAIALTGVFLAVRELRPVSGRPAAPVPA